MQRTATPCTSVRFRSQPPFTMKNWLNFNEKLYKSNLKIKNDSVEIDKVLPHEEILPDRLNGLKKYIKSLEPNLIVPSIIICSKTGVIIDGHHRYYALKEYGISFVPVTKINYESEIIITHTEEKKVIDKQQVVSAAQARKLLKPKTTAHHINVADKILPVITLSSLFVYND